MATRGFVTLVAAGAVSVASHACADQIIYNLRWEGAPFGNDAVATGTVTVDEALLPQPGFYAGTYTSGPFSNLEVTVTGADVGNGTFTSAAGEFHIALWMTTEALDLSQELVGQAGFDNFNVFAPAGSEAPAGVESFIIRTLNGVGDQLILTSMIASNAGCEGDLDNDNEVGVGDLAILLGNWGPVPPNDPIADLNEDGIVDAADLAILLGNWGTCAE